MSSWQLRSGRFVNVNRNEMATVFLHEENGIVEPVWDSVNDEVDRACFYNEDDADELTFDERRELADAAKEAWDRWAETGKFF